MTTTITAAEYRELTATPQKRGRYPVGAIEKRTADGHIFDSIKEKKRYVKLRWREIAGQIRRLELQPAFPVWIRGELFCTFTADFSYIECAGDRQVIEDVKSSGTRKDPAYRLRKKAAQLEYGIKVVEV
jgi:hypothetical protein